MLTIPAVTTGQQIFDARIESGITQKQLAAIAGLNVSSIRRIEKMDKIPASSWFAPRRIMIALLIQALDDQRASLVDQLIELDKCRPGWD